MILKIRELYASAKTRIRENGKLSRDVKIGKGVLQGETLSPTLFSLFLNKIVAELETEGLNGVRWGDGQVALLLYADDQVLVSSHPSGLQRLINKIASLFKGMKLKVNLAKTKVMVFRRGGKLPKKLRFTWEDDNVEIVSEYVYLGVKFSSSGKFGRAKEVFFKKANTALQNLQCLIRKSRTKDVRVAHKLFVALVTSVLLYGAPVWGLLYVQEFDRFQTKFLRWFFSLTNSTPGYFIRLETGIENITCSLFKAVIKFMYRALKSDSKIMQQSVTESKNIKQDDVKINWWKQLAEFFKNGGLHEDARELSTDYITQNYSSMVARFCQSTLMKDIEDMRSDYRFSEYSKIKTKVGPSEYIEGDVKDDVKKFLLSVRSTFPRIIINGKSVNLNAVWKIWKTNKERKPTECLLCNLNEDEDILHIMLRCPQYKYIRLAHLTNVELGGTIVTGYEKSNEYGVKIIYSNRQETWAKLYSFWTYAVKLREAYLNIMDEES